MHKHKTNTPNGGFFLSQPAHIRLWLIYHCLLHMHMNGTAPLEASSEEASTSAYSRMTVLRHDATENVSAKKEKKIHPACCILMMLSSVVYASVTSLTWKNSDKYKKKTPVDPYLYLTWSNATLKKKKKK